MDPLSPRAVNSRIVPDTPPTTTAESRRAPGAVRETRQSQHFAAPKRREPTSVVLPLASEPASVFGTPALSTSSGKQEQLERDARALLAELGSGPLDAQLAGLRQGLQQALDVVSLGQPEVARLLLESWLSLAEQRRSAGVAAQPAPSAPASSASSAASSARQWTWDMFSPTDRLLHESKGITPEQLAQSRGYTYIPPGPNTREYTWDDFSPRDRQLAEAAGLSPNDLARSRGYGGYRDEYIARTEQEREQAIRAAEEWDRAHPNGDGQNPPSIGPYEAAAATDQAAAAQSPASAFAPDLGTYGQPPPVGADGKGFAERGYYLDEAEREAYLEWLRYNAEPGSLAANLTPNYVGSPDYQANVARIAQDAADYAAAHPDQVSVIGPS